MSKDTETSKQHTPDTVTEAWEQYRTACYGAGPMTPVQKAETRQAFFAGAFIALKMILMAVEDEAMEDFERIQSEIMQEMNRRITELNAPNN